jgi:hypothetical protein
LAILSQKEMEADPNIEDKRIANIDINSIRVKEDKTGFDYKRDDGDQRSAKALVHPLFEDNDKGWLWNIPYGSTTLLCGYRPFPKEQKPTTQKEAEATFQQILVTFYEDDREDGMWRLLLNGAHERLIKSIKEGKKYKNQRWDMNGNPIKDSKLVQRSEDLQMSEEVEEAEAA